MITYSKRFGIVLALVIVACGGFAQNGVNSPFTRYGFGQLSDQSLGGNQAMGGIGIGLRDGTQINVSNPASYSDVDSLTFLFEVGMSLQNANFSDGATKLNAKNSSFDYLAMQFRLFKRMGMTIGFLPYSSVGYKFSSTETIPPASEWDDAVTATRSYSGSGGLHQGFVGIGYGISPQLSVGLNAAFLFGNFSHQIDATFSDANADPLSRKYYANVSDLTLDFGAQYTMEFDENKKHRMTLGVTYSLGQDLHTSEAYVSNTSSADETKYVSHAFQLPHAFGAGGTYTYDNRLTVGADFKLQKFGDVRYFGEKGQLADRLKCSLGVQYLPDDMTTSFFKSLKYRFGLYYSKPYVKVDGRQAAREYGVSLGFACPIFTRWNTLGGRQFSILNVSGGWVKVDPIVDGVLTENYLRLSLGLTFNQGWFYKQKVR